MDVTPRRRIKRSKRRKVIDETISTNPADELLTENNGSPSMHGDFFKNENSSPSCITWDFARPSPSKSVREAACRLDKELKQHRLNRRKFSSPSNTITPSRSHKENLIESPNCIEHYKASLNYIKSKLEAAFSCGPSSDSAPESDKEDNTAFLKHNLKVHEEKEKTLKGENKYMHEDKVNSSKLERKIPQVSTNDHVLKVEDYFNDSFDEVMVSCSQMLEEKFSSSQFGKTNVQHIQELKKHTQENKATSDKRDNEILNNILNDSNDDLFLQLDI